MNITILNLTQHPATTDQIAAGVRDLQGQALAMLKGCLNFDTLPTVEDIRQRAEDIAMLASAWHDAEDPDGTTARACMIGGAPFFMGALEAALYRRDLTPLYAFSRREVVENTNPDGTVTKTAVFKHEGFVAGGIV